MMIILNMTNLTNVIQSNSVITNTRGPSRNVRYNREKYPYTVSCHLGPKMGHYFVRYKREFVITVIVLTEFDCSCFQPLNVMAFQKSHFLINIVG
jgi:hypothetical protein